MTTQRGALQLNVSVALAIVFLVAAVAWWITPTLNVDVGGNRALVHMELLGEYPSDVRSIEIDRDDQPTPIWKIVADGNMFQIHSIPLIAGDNAGNAHVSWGKSRQLIPESATTFRLESGIAYRIEVCSASFLRLCRSANFTLARR